jgi:hypothetical protein
MAIDLLIATHPCSHGSQYARDVLQHMYFKHGKAFSLLDWQRGYGDVEIEVPGSYLPLHRLLSQRTGVSDSRPRDQSNKQTSQARKTSENYISETDNVDRKEKAKDNRSADQADRDSENLSQFMLLV